MAVKANNDTFEAEILSSDEGVVIADFYSDSCVPCKRMSPILAEIEEENSKLKIVKLNINFDGETAEKYDVTAVPTLVIFKNGREISRLVGAVKKSDIIEAVNSVN